MKKFHLYNIGINIMTTFAAYLVNLFYSLKFFSYDTFS